MKTKNYLFLLLLILLILLNIFLFPKLDFYINYSTYLAIIIGILGSILAVNIFRNTQLHKNKSVITLFVPIIVFFGLTLFNVFYPVDVEDEILDKNGVETIAQITAKDHTKFRRAETFEFSIQFKNQNGEIINTDVSTLLPEYEKHNVGDIVKVKYSSENNKLVRLVSE